MGNSTLDKPGRLRLPTIPSLLFFPAIFILHNLNFYRDLLLYSKGYELMAVYLLLPILLYVLLRKLFRVREETAAMTVLLASFLFFFFGALQDFLELRNLTRPFSKTPVLLTCFLLVSLLVLTQKAVLKKWISILFTVLAIFFFTEVGFLLFHLPHFRKTPKLKGELSLSTGRAQRLDSMNVYHFIFDGYTNSKTLRELFHFQNPVDSFLQAKGFYVAGNTKSNYNFTPYSLSATLNLRYLDLTKKGLQRDFNNFLFGSQVYRQNFIFRFFQNRHYRVSHYSFLDDYDELDKLGIFAPKTPVFMLRLQTLERIQLNNWLWAKLSGSEFTEEVKESMQNDIRYNQQAFRHALPSEGKLQYNFTHFFLPHDPYIFSKESINALHFDDLMNHETGYVKQVEYVNGLIKTLVTELQKNPHNIIIIQGDHGFREYDPSADPELTQNEAFNAIYFPDRNYSRLYDSISLVNTYRVVLNHYFGQQLPLLPDQYFVPGKD